MNTPLLNCTGPTVKSNNTIVSCPLDCCQFSMGGAVAERYRELSRGLKMKNDSLILVHANFLNGNGAKYIGLLRHGFWITNYPRPGCRTYNGTL